MMKHYVLGLIFNEAKTQILLVDKLRPDWMKDRVNGIGGKIDDGETPFDAIHRESKEETSYDFDFKHTITFVCPGGTVFVYIAVCFGDITYKQIEDERLAVWELYNLPNNMISNLKWIIPLSLSTIKKPILLHQEELEIR